MVPLKLNVTVKLDSKAMIVVSDSVLQTATTPIKLTVGSVMQVFATVRISMLVMTVVYS
jgi:hypothetical protein